MPEHIFMTVHAVDVVLLGFDIEIQSGVCSGRLTGSVHR